MPLDCWVVQCWWRRSPSPVWEWGTRLAEQWSTRRGCSVYSERTQDEVSTAAPIAAIDPTPSHYLHPLPPLPRTSLQTCLQWSVGQRQPSLWWTTNRKKNWTKYWKTTSQNSMNSLSSLCQLTDHVLNLSSRSNCSAFRVPSMASQPLLNTE